MKASRKPRKESFEFELITLVLAGAILFFISELIGQHFVGGNGINWFQAFAGAVIFAILSTVVIKVRPERRLIAIILFAVIVLVLIGCSVITGILPW